MIFIFFACADIPEATSTIHPLEGTSTSIPSIENEMVMFDSSSFAMGYPDNPPGPYGNHWKENAQPIHQVSLSGYSLDKTEVTVSQYTEFLNSINHSGSAAAYKHTHPLQPITLQDGSFSPATSAENNRPMRYVSWYDAVTYCAWAGKRLPTEAEWEHAAKGNDPENPRSFPWVEGGATCAKAIYYTNRSLCSEHPIPVGSLPDGFTPEGVADLAGNVSEWVSDWYDRYPTAEQFDPQGPITGIHKVIRGGSYRETSDALRTTDRVIANPLSRSSGIGFRCAQ